MTRHPLPLGPLAVDGFVVARSGVRWLVQDGHACAAGEPVGYCNIGLLPSPGDPHPAPFPEDRRDFQACLVTRNAGVLRHRAGLSPGGELDLQHFDLPWDPAEIAATLENDEPACDGLDVLFMAGRRVGEVAEDRKGLLTGWHDRARAWHGGRDGHLTVLSYGICEQNGIIRGERQTFFELLAHSPVALHAIHMNDEALVPSAPVLLGQLQRSQADRDAIAAAMAQEFLNAGVTPGAGDYIFMGAALRALLQSPLTDETDVLTRTGLHHAEPPSVVVLSLNAEFATVLRHRRLGYIANWHLFRLRAGGAAAEAWVRANFEPVRRSPSDIRKDLRTLIDTAACRTGARFVILNSQTTNANENITNYAAFAGPLHKTLSSVRAKEMNVMLEDLAAECPVTVIDADGIAAELGAGAHIPDGIHHSRQMQEAIRHAILDALQPAPVMRRAAAG